MMKCLVIDDEPKALDILKDYIQKVPFLELAGAYRDSLKALNYLQNHPVDLIFLDINMPDLTGIQFLNALTARPLVIFSTAYSEYAVGSYDYNAVDYLLKPIEFERFLKAANKAWEQFQLKNSKSSIKTSASSSKREENHDYILIKSGTDFHRIDMNEILYIKGAGNYVTFITKNDKIMSLLNMKDILRMLPSNQFFRIHKSYIVNFRHVALIEKDRVKIKGKKIPIGEVYRDHFLKAIHST